MPRVLGLCGLLAALLTAPGLAAQDDYTYRIIDGSAPLGATGEIIVVLDNNGANLAGYSVALCHDTDLISFDSDEDIVNGAGLTGVTFLFAQTRVVEEDDVNIGWTVGTALSLGEVLSPAVNIELYEVTYESIAEGDSDMEFCAIGSPEVRPTVVDELLVEIDEDSGLELVNGIFESGGVAPFTLTIDSVEAAQGTDVDVGIVAGGPEDFDAFSFGIAFDDEFLTLNDIAVGSGLEGLNDDEGPAYFQVNLLDDDSSATVGCVADLKAPFETISAADEPEIAILQFTVDPATPDATPVAIGFSGSVGDPAVPVVISVQGFSKPPTRTDGEVLVQGDPIPVFLRADSNTDGFVDISDVMHIARFIFVDGEAPQCSEAADVNDNDEITIGDALALVSYLFEGGAEPPAPFPECDLDPDEEDSLGCETTQADACI